MVSLHFFLVNSSFLFRFLLKVEGLFLFFSTSLEGWFSLVTRETVREVPRVRLRVKCCPLLASTWQNSRNWLNRAGSPPLTVEGIIFTG